MEERKGRGLGRNEKKKERINEKEKLKMHETNRNVSDCMKTAKNRRKEGNEQKMGADHFEERERKGKKKCLGGEEKYRTNRMWSEKRKQKR